MPDVPDYEYLTVAQVSKIYGVPRTTVYSWFECGLGYKMLPNGRHQILREDVENFTRHNLLVAPWRVLIADDDAGFLALITKALDEAGFNCIASDNVVDAIFKSKKFKPDLLIVDISFPKQSGFDIAEAIKKDTLGDVPVLFMSGKVSGSEVLDKGMDQNCVGFLEKPFTIEKLINEVKQVFKHFGKKMERR
jgi:CheY-like chemotaxis protein